MPNGRGILGLDDFDDFNDFDDFDARGILIDTLVMFYNMVVVLVVIEIETLVTLVGR